MPITDRGSTTLSRDDIPLARRMVSPALKPRGAFRRGLMASGLVLGSAIVLAAVFSQPLRRWLAPPPVAGLQAKPDGDGRLLNHFPYAEAPAGELQSVAPGLLLRRDAAQALLAMQQAAAADGVDLRVLSGFRSIGLQKTLFFDVKSDRNQSAQERAQVSAPPGYSEHSTGFAVDLGDGKDPGSNLSAAFERSEAFTWLKAKANIFHFHLSFPRGNRQGVSYEPWHWRFEGSADALKTFDPAQRLGF